MFKKQRQQKILDIVNQCEYVSVNKLSKTLYASLPTIRRDLSQLEKAGMIVRSHGGAMKLTDGTYLTPLEYRSGKDTHQKLEMCKKAAKLIRDGDVIYIDASTSSLHMADYITAQNITVVTNGIPIATLLSKKGIKTIFAGGDILPLSLGCGGRFAEDIVSSFNYNLAFFSAHGINQSGVIVDTSLPETLVRKQVFKTTLKKVFLYAKSKENLNAPYNVANLSDVEIVITQE